MYTKNMYTEYIYIYNIVEIMDIYSDVPYIYIRKIYE